MSDWTGSDATELSAAVVPSAVQYRYHCAPCDVRGSTYDNAQDAQNEGLQHELSVHPRVFSVEQLGGS